MGISVSTRHPCSLSYFFFFPFMPMLTHQLFKNLSHSTTRTARADTLQAPSGDTKSNTRERRIMTAYNVPSAPDYATWYDQNPNPNGYDVSSTGGSAARNPGRIVNKVIHHAGTAAANKVNHADIAGPLWATFGLVLFVIL